MLVLYRAFGVLYLVSGIWCSVQINNASSFLGFSLISPNGFAEFLSVYGGLQVGLGLAMLTTSFQVKYIEASVYFSAIFSSCLAVFRLISFSIYGVIADFVIMLIIELVIAAGLWLVWYKHKSINN